jgi:hypothetical protein
MVSHGQSWSVMVNHGQSWSKNMVKKHGQTTMAETVRSNFEARKRKEQTITIHHLSYIPASLQWLDTFDTAAMAGLALFNTFGMMRLGLIQHLLIGTFFDTAWRGFIHVNTFFRHGTHGTAWLYSNLL